MATTTDTAEAPEQPMSDADKWRVIRELLMRGYHRHDWDYNSDTEELTFECYDKRVVGEDTDDCLRQMLAATNPTTQILGEPAPAESGD